MFDDYEVEQEVVNERFWRVVQNSIPVFELDSYDLDGGLEK